MPHVRSALRASPDADHRPRQAAPPAFGLLRQTLLLPLAAQAEGGQNVGDHAEPHDDDAESRTTRLTGQSDQRADQPADDELNEA